jgi:hypothetical protein
MHQKLSNKFEILERFLRLIRPRFHNRLAWVVVGAGLLLTATPWWGGIINALAQQQFGVSVPVSTEHTTIGLVFVVAGLVYHLLTHSIHEFVVSRREAAELGARGDHDRKVFLGFTAAVPERQLLDLLRSIVTLHQYWSRDGTLIRCAIDYLRAPSTQFVADDIAAAAIALALAIDNLENFLALNCVEHMSPPNGDMRFCLFPDGNIDRSRGIPSSEQSQRYAELSHQLEQYVIEAENGYASFRSVVKRRLAV